MAIVVLTPSRERPDELRAMLDAIDETAVTDVLTIVGVDNDDPTIDEYPSAGIHVAPGGTTTLVTHGERDQLAGWTNRLAIGIDHHPDTILASFGDDHRPRTLGWDLHVERAMAKYGKGLVYARDGLQDERLPTAPFWSAEIIRALGFYFPPVLKHMWADNFWRAFADGLGRRHYLPDVLIEHCHPDAPNGRAADAVNVANDAHERDDRDNFHAFLRSREYIDCLDRCREVL